MQIRTGRGLAVVVAIALLLAACGPDEAVEEVVASPSPTPSASASPTPTPSPTPTGPFALLTGEPVDQAAMTRPALSVKVENTAKARPQAGLETADIVFEELVEGGITRFFAVFQSEVPEQIGPVRSARLVDATLLPAFDGILLYSGGRDDVEAAISGTARRITEGASGVYRQSGRSAPSNLFADGPAVYETALEREPDLGPPPAWFSFDPTPPPGGTPGASIEISMSTQATSGWTHDPSAGGYLRSQNGTPQPTVSDEPVVAANVVVVGVDLVEGGCCDTAGSPYVVSRTIDSGRAIVLRDGSWYEAQWSRADASSPLQLVRDGAPMPLAPGPTWIHLTPNSRLPAAP